ncbi:MAG TPA: hypothetical protein EYH20_02230 [Leucothrix sp.]|nr:hypothetical protein [Leucothrix sp.]
MKIIITVLVVLLGLGGGAYYAQDSNLYDFKQLKQYIPSQVKELLNIEDTQVVSVFSDELEVISDTDQNQNLQDISDTDQNQNLQDFTQDPLFDSQTTTEQQSQAETVYSGSDSSDIVKPATENIAENKKELPSKINQKIQTAMLDNSSNTLQEKSAIQVLDASPEEMKIVNELNKIESKIVMLDNEKEDLEKKYYRMIKKNRELAMKIKEIDHQIKVINSQ